MFILRKDVQDALRAFNLRTIGHDMEPNRVITDPIVVARVHKMALPGEDPNDTILRLLRKDGWITTH